MQAGQSSHQQAKLGNTDDFAIDIAAIQCLEDATPAFLNHREGVRGVFEEVGVGAGVAVDAGR